MRKKSVKNSAASSEALAQKGGGQEPSSSTSPPEATAVATTANMQNPPSESPTAPVEVIDPDKTNGDLPWSGNPDFTRKEAWDALKKGHAPMSPMMLRQLANLLLAGKTAEQISEITGYSIGVAKQLSHDPKVQSQMEKTLRDAGLDEGFVTNKLRQLADAKKVVVAKEHGQITDEREYDDGALQLKTVVKIGDFLGVDPHKKIQAHAEKGSKFVIHLNQEMNNVFFGGPTEPESKDTPHE